MSRDALGWIATAIAWLGCSSVCGCSPVWEPPAPPPVHAIPAPPPLWPPDPRVLPTAALASAVVETTTAVVDAGPPAATGPTPSITLETPYKMGERVEPKTREAYLVDWRDRKRWNDGAMGELIGDAAPVVGHPDPRVIVNVDKVQGPHDAKRLQRSARRYHWINVVRCYRLGAYKDPHLRGWTKAVVTVDRNGRVRRPRLLETKLKDDAVARCMVKRLGKLRLHRARKISRVWLSMRVGPGDEPMPPPEDLLVAGDGQLSLSDMTTGVRAGLPAMKTCYRAAFDYAPGLWGRIVIRFHLTKAGRVDEAFEAGSRFPDARMRQCVLHAARKLGFPKPAGADIRFVVPLRFFSDRSKHLKQ